MSENFISVIITTYNRRKYLTKAIDSILKQTYKRYEIIIIDDDSSDDTYEYICKYYKYSNIRIFVSITNILILEYLKIIKT